MTCTKCGHDARHHWSPAWCQPWDGVTFKCACRCEASRADMAPREATASPAKEKPHG